MNDGGGFIQLLSVTFSAFCVLRTAGEKAKHLDLLSLNMRMLPMPDTGDQSIVAGVCSVLLPSLPGPHRQYRSGPQRNT